MTDEEVREEYDRRLDAIYNKYGEAIRAYEAATKKKDQTRKELEVWFRENYDGPLPSDGWVVRL